MQKHLSSHRQKGEVAGQVFWMGNPMEDPKDPKMDMDQDHIFIDQEWHHKHSHKPRVANYSHHKEQRTQNEVFQNLDNSDITLNMMIYCLA